MKLRNLLILAVTVICLAACNTSNFEEPVFKDLKNVKLKDLQGNMATISAEAVVFNPNKKSGKLTDIVLDVWIDGKELGHIKQTHDLKIPAESEFNIPIETTIDLKQLDQSLLSRALDIIGGKKFDVKYVGHVKVKVMGIGFKIPVEEEKKLGIKLM